MNADSKPLKLTSLTALVVGNMVGSGIFLLPANMASFGAISILSWSLTVVGTLFLGMTLAKNSQLVQENGGPYAYAKNGFGNFIGFQTAYCHWIGIWVAIAALVIAMIGYLAYLWPCLKNPIYAGILAIATIWLAVLINISGVKTVGRTQIITVILKLLPILLLIAFGFSYFNAENLAQDFEKLEHTFNFSTFSAAAGLTLWAFIGVESATIPYSYIENPKRNIPLATFLGTIIAAIVYIASSTLIMGILPKETLIATQFPFVAVAEMIFGNAGKWIMSIGAAISCFGCINGWTFLQGQISMAAAEKGLFPKFFSLRNKAQVPAWGLAITGVLISVLFLLSLDVQETSKFKLITIMASFATLVPYIYATVAGIMLLKKEAYYIGEMNTLKRHFYLLLAFLAAIYSFWAICGIGEKALAYGALLLFSSILLYSWERH